MPNTTVSIIASKFFHNHSLHNVYHCNNSTKYISKYRLIDGIAVFWVFRRKGVLREKVTSGMERACRDLLGTGDGLVGAGPG